MQIRELQPVRTHYLRVTPDLLEHPHPTIHIQWQIK